MTDQTDLLRSRLQALLAQAEFDRASLQNTPAGTAMYADLFDSLLNTLHNLPASVAVEARDD
jgi:hypothetical protein